MFTIIDFRYNVETFIINAKTIFFINETKS